MTKFQNIAKAAFASGDFSADSKHVMNALNNNSGTSASDALCLIAYESVHRQYAHQPRPIGSKSITFFNNTDGSFHDIIIGNCSKKDN